MSQNNFRSIPVYRKALDLCTISREIASFVSYNKDLLKLYQSNSLRDHIADSLLTDAILIPKHIAEAETSESQADRMKSARFINIMIRNIISYCNGLEKDGVKEKEYLNLLRKEIKSFRKTFRIWRKSLGRNRDGHWGLNDSFGF
jgi:hypothetical protein